MPSPSSPMTVAMRHRAQPVQLPAPTTFDSHWLQYVLYHALSIVARVLPPCGQHCPHSTASAAPTVLPLVHAHLAPCVRHTPLPPSFPSQLNQSFENGDDGPRGTAHAQPKKEVNPAPDIPTRALYCGCDCGPAWSPSRLMQRWTCFPALDPLASPLLPQPPTLLPSGHACNVSLFSILFHSIYGTL